MYYYILYYTISVFIATRWHYIIIAFKKKKEKKTKTVLTGRCDIFIYAK